MPIRGRDASRLLSTSLRANAWWRAKPLPVIDRSTAALFVDIIGAASL
jgi:hypothetical protein